MPALWIQIGIVGLDMAAAWRGMLLGGAYGKGQLSVIAWHSPLCVPRPDSGDLF